MNYLRLTVYTYGDTAITDMVPTTGSTYFGNPGVGRHGCIIQNTHSIIPSSWSHALLPSFDSSTHFGWFLMHSCQAFIDPRHLCGSSSPGIPSYPLTLFLQCSSQNCSFSRIRFRCHAGCGTVLMMGCLPSSSTSSPQHDEVNLVVHSEAVIEWVCMP